MFVGLLVLFCGSFCNGGNFLKKQKKCFSAGPIMKPENNTQASKLNGPGEAIVL
jgi:hypothetical protein